MSTERVVIVGGGVVGTMHALQACQRGWEVIHLEADAGPRRASVRDFGLLWVSGRAPGPELDLALRARRLWADIAGRAPGIGFRADGSLTVAGDDSELALMAEAVQQPDASSRGFELPRRDPVRGLESGHQRRHRGRPLVWHGRRGRARLGVGCAPSTARGDRQLPLAAGPAGHRCANRRSGRQCRTGRHRPLGYRSRGSLVVLCIGDRLSGLGGRSVPTWLPAPLRRCRLQMT